MGRPDLLDDARSCARFILDRMATEGGRLLRSWSEGEPHIAGFLGDTRVLTITAVVFAIAIAYFGLYSRHHIVGTAPEEEFALIESAESELH